MRTDFSLTLVSTRQKWEKKITLEDNICRCGVLLLLLLLMLLLLMSLSVVGVCLFKLILKFHTCTHTYTLTPYSPKKSFLDYFVLMLSNDGFIFIFFVVASFRCLEPLFFVHLSLYMYMYVYVCVCLYENLLR